MKTVEIEVGDIVRIVRDNEYWNGLEGVVLGIGVHDDSKYPYHLVIINSTEKAPDGKGRITDVSPGSVKLVRKRDYRWDAIDHTIATEFHGVLDVFKSELSGNAVVLTANGDMFRVMSDGMIDPHI